MPLTPNDSGGRHATAPGASRTHAVDVPVALLGYGTVGAAVHRLLIEQGDEIERATGHRLRVARALVRDRSKERGFDASPDLLTTRAEEILEDQSIRLVAEMMGGVSPAREYVLSLLRTGRSVVTANKQLVARHGPELFAAAAASGRQLRFEASVCAAIPVISALRESLVSTQVHRVLGIVNGTTNFILSGMETGAAYDEALAEAQRLGLAEADPTDDVAGHDAAAKIAILATVAFGSRVPVEWVRVRGIEGIDAEHIAAARALEMHVKLVARASLVEGCVDVHVGPAMVDSHHPLSQVEGAFNAVMLQGNSIREITLEGPGAGGIETASAVVADLVKIVGTAGTGFLQNDPVWRELPRLPNGAFASPFYVRLHVADRVGVLARIAQELARQEVSVAKLVQQPADGAAVLHIVTHQAPAGRVETALEAIETLPESRGPASVLPVVSDRGVEELGWT